MAKNRLIGIIGATALGKTKLAAHLASKIKGGIISADSRQVYRGMDIGTGKDLNEFIIDGSKIPYHLIDIVEAGDEYNVFQFQRDFYIAYSEVLNNNHVPILCGGTGMYIEAVLSPKQLLEVPINTKVRTKLSVLELEELQKMLMELRPNLHNTTDLLDKQRLIRAIEIEEFKLENPYVEKDSPIESYILFGLKTERAKLHKRIEKRLDHRLKNGLIEEVETLLKSGVDHETLRYYGLEYKYVSAYLKNEMQKNDMRNHLLKAIKQFAKRQETWYRRMEKKGQKIHWLDAEKPVEENLKCILTIIN